MKRFFIIFLAIIFLLIIVYFKFFSGDPFNKIRNSEPKTGLFYLSYYQIAMRNSSFNALLRRLIKDNMDLQSMGVAVNFVVNNELCFFVPEIETKCNILKNFPVDTSWKVQISASYIRNWGVNETGFGYSMCNRIKELKAKCHKDN